MNTTTNFHDTDGHRHLPNILLQHLRRAVAVKCEAQCAYHLASYPYFVQGAESASVDCGLLDMEPPLEFRDKTQRLFKLTEEPHSSKKMLPLDIKSMVPRESKESRGGVAYHTIASSPSQMTIVAAFIVLSPMSPELVALIPRHYIARFKSSSEGYYGREIPISRGEMPSFSLELMPFVMPIGCLPQALQIMLDFAKKRRAVWNNPFNGISFLSCPPPSFHTLNLLRPAESDCNQEFDRLRQLWTKLETHSSRYRLEVLTLQPAVGDFQIRHLASDCESVFEMKTSFARISSGTVLHHAKWRKRGPKPGWLFAPTSTWDFLWTMTPSQDVVVVGRDDLPTSWFCPEPIDDLEAEHTWVPEGRSLMSHVIPSNCSDKMFVAKFERILDDYRRRNAWRSKRSLPLVETTYSDLDIAPDNSVDGELSRPPQKPPLRGTVRNWSTFLWEAEMEAKIVQDCIDFGKGHLIRVGHNPSGRFVFILARREQGKDILFEDLPLLTPMFYVNFALVDPLDSRLPTDARHSRLFWRATHGPHPSIYVLLPAPHTQTWESVCRFVVPSTAIDRADRSTMNDRLMRSGSGVNGPEPLRLAQDEMIDAYARTPGGVVQELCSILEQPVGTKTKFIGDTNTGVGTRITLEEVVINKKTVLQETMDILDGRTFLGKMQQDDLEE